MIFPIAQRLKKQMMPRAKDAPDLGPSYLYRLCFLLLVTVLADTSIASLGTPHSSPAASNLPHTSPQSNESPSSGVRGVTFPKGQITLLVIKAGDIQVTLTGHDSDKLDMTTTGSPSVSKNKSVLIVKPSQKGKIMGNMIVPHGTRVVIQGANVNANLDGFMGDLDVRGGMVHMVGSGRLSKLSVRAAQAKLLVRGVIGSTDIDCADGTIDLVYEKEKVEKMDALISKPDQETWKSKESPYTSSGLLLHEPAIRIKLHLAKGRATFFFPPQSTVRYPKEVEGIQSVIDYASKRPTFNISPYLSAPAELFLRSSDDFQSPQLKNNGLANDF